MRPPRGATSSGSVRPRDRSSIASTDAGTGTSRGTPDFARRTSTRAIKSVNEDVRVNRALWLLAERMAEIKAA